MTETPSYTIRSRQAPEVGNDASARAQARSRFAVDTVDATPATASKPPGPHGDMSEASIDTLISLAATLGSTEKSQRNKRIRGTRKLLAHLEAFPGETWQDRWLASGFDHTGTPVRSLGSTKYDGYELIMGAESLFLLRAVTPSLTGFRSNKFSAYPRHFEASQRDAGVTRFFGRVTEVGAEARYQDVAKFDLCCLMTTQGIAFADITPAAVLHYAIECRRLGLVAGVTKSAKGHFAGLLLWEVLQGMGQFPAGTPPALRSMMYRGQLTAEELIDRYNLQNSGVRQLLIDYLRRRQGDTDYNTRHNLAGMIGYNFWAKIEELSPGQPDLNLSEDLYNQWKETIRLRRDGAPRTSIQSILLPVRALYLDIQSWALDEPERWAQWAAPCPIPQADLRGFSKRRRRIKERVDDRIRVRQPLLPILVAHVEDRIDHLAGLLRRARELPLGASFEHGEGTYERTNSSTDRRNHALGIHTVRVIEHATGDTIDVVAAEESAFWEWAYVEVLRHSGIRVEELAELSHTSLRRYVRPSGEAVALLVVAPSKTDRERVIPCSPELFHVLAQVVRRLTANGPIPIIARYDDHERQLTDSLPFLFQRQIGGVRRVITGSSVLNALKKPCMRLAATVPAFRDLTFTPHDFRRLFATEAMNNGLPIHIGAALLGHVSVDTTRGYVGVFAEDVIVHYQRYLDTRRSLRPAEEYRPATNEEWDEFEEHFDKRKVELGSCGRPYGTPCSHEHSCIRCPMLHVNPKMVGRLDELEIDLLDRRQRALTEEWKGEIEGIDLTLQCLRDKRDETKRMTRTTTTISLGMPVADDGAARKETAMASDFEEDPFAALD